MAEASKVAMVVDALTTYSGAERVLVAALELYPKAPIYSLVYKPSSFADTEIYKRRVVTSWIQRLPGGVGHYRDYLPLLPLAVEKFDLRGYDIVLSFSYAVAHGVLCGPDQLHISYTHAPLRYAWQSVHDYYQHGSLSTAAMLIMHYLRLWDQVAASRVDHFAANSNWTADCIWRAYRREAEVIYPPVEIEHYKHLTPRKGYYLAFSRLVRHKKLELIVQAFTELNLPLIVLGEGPDQKRLQRLAGSSIKFLGRQSSETTAELLGQARALVHAAEEDFGIVMAEAQAAGCPVIAYARGAAREIIREGKTGSTFKEQTVESVMAAVESFEHQVKPYRTGDIRRNAQRFGKSRLQEEFKNMVDSQWKRFLLRTSHERVSDTTKARGKDTNK